MNDPSPAAPPERSAEPSICPNCGALAPGRFCASCGQRQDRRLASIRRMAVEAIQDQLSLGSELPRTLSLLLLRPGLLTKEYLAGRIARYVPPLRLYLAASLAFFFITSFGNGSGPDVTVLGSASDSVAGQTLGERSPVAIGLDVDSASLPRPLLPVLGYLQRRAERLNTMNARDFQARFMSGLRENAPRAVFVLLPIAALILKLLYVRDRRLYAEHFIFALHVHSFVFLVLLISGLLPGNLGSLVTVPWVAIYVYMAMLRVYRQSKLKTFLKYGMFWGAYFAAQVIVLAGTAVVTALTL